MTVEIVIGTTIYCALCVVAFAELLSRRIKKEIEEKVMVNPA